MNFSNAVKAFIVKGDMVLLLKRRSDDVSRPGTWDIVGGRLEFGENPFSGVRREVKEECGLAIKICAPLGVHYFKRDDGQQIMLVSFLCICNDQDIVLNEEHTEYKWVKINEIFSYLHDGFRRDVLIFNEYYRGKRWKGLY